MSEQRQVSLVREVKRPRQAAKDLDVFILASGFEDRAIAALRTLQFASGAHCVLLRYKNNVTGNRAIFDNYLAIATAKFGDNFVHVVDISSASIDQFSGELRSCLLSLPRDAHAFGIDISGCTSYAICLILKVLRDLYPFNSQRIFYTSAASYVPDRAEYDGLVARNPSTFEIDYLPKSMALEMSENLVLDEFSGHRSGDGRACLAVFAGYEVHRSSGVIEAINPSLLLLMYGLPGDPSLGWRLDLSKRLHSKFEGNRRTAAETVSTLDPAQGLATLEQYYQYLTDDYDLVVSPICSKMHSVAAYLFWERYGEVQLTFPLPIGYNTALAPQGVGKMYNVDLAERHALFREPAALGE